MARGHCHGNRRRGGAVGRGRAGGAEAAGQLLCLLARRADRVVRVFYGLPLTLKENGAEDV